MTPRLSPAVPPFPEEVQARLAKLMGDRPPLTLFATLARDPRLFERFMAGGLLDRGNLSLRIREIVIDRITALAKSEYEWGVHVAFFAEKARLTEDQIRSTARGGASDPCWAAEEQAVIVACDQLHHSCNLDDAAWTGLKANFKDEAILEILMLAGIYRTVSYLTNALRMTLEDFGRRFPAA
jgi:alkylhydroperoxidase family enzyme